MENGHIEIVKCLLRNGATLKKRSDKDGDRAVHHASFGDEPEVVDLLSSNSADLNARNKRRQTPLHVAVNKGHLGVIRVLLQHTVPCQSRRGNIGALRHILPRLPALCGVDDQKDDGFTSLHLSALNNHLEASQALLQAGANPNIQNVNLQTPLHLAVERRNIQIVRLLVEEGANPDMGDKFGDRPLHEALRHHTMSQLKQPSSSSQNGSLSTCLVCETGRRAVLLLPCAHVATCEKCQVSSCPICRQPVSHSNRIEECVVCSKAEASVVFKPCLHMVACDSCSSIMTKCVKCRTAIETAVPLSVASGGRLEISCDLVEISCDLVEISCDLVEVSCDLVEISCDLVEISCDLVEISCDLVEISCDLVEVSCDLVEVSCDLVEISCDLVEISCDLVEISCDLVEGSAISIEPYVYLPSSSHSSQANVSQLLRHMFEEHQSSSPGEELVKCAASGDVSRVEDLLRGGEVVLVDVPFLMEVPLSRLPVSSSIRYEGPYQRFHVYLYSLLPPSLYLSLVSRGGITSEPSVTSSTRLRPCVCVDDQKDDGFTSLHLSALNNHLEASQALLQAGLEPTLLYLARIQISRRNSQTRSPAVDRRNIQIVHDSLVEEGANPDMGDKFGDRSAPRARGTPTPHHVPAEHTFRRRSAGYCGAASSSQNGSLSTCLVCETGRRAVLLLPCAHVATCEKCQVSSCPICRQPVSHSNRIEECVVCSKAEASVVFKPCLHMVACDSCSSIMMKCVKCRTAIRGPPLKVRGRGSRGSGGPVGSQDIASLQQQLQEMKEKTQCQVCMDRRKNCVFLCGHGTCQLCADKIIECPICRKLVSRKIILFD
ncbi:E3 ubiquitin-protein ligase MIB1 [Geodia barretti]|uniref:E3 ubiquitin-protein ligase MIB1 n=1 Tax=Geodia barretti TaxID=519541 RepID=A0AA35XA56_GEOBA|nr:E3 ubiquitin-protein ligase MIB1 [Geodia barretti]